jgi:hypothetical protein
MLGRFTGSLKGCFLVGAREASQSGQLSFDILILRGSPPRILPVDAVASIQGGLNDFKHPLCLIAFDGAFLSAVSFKIINQFS